MAMDHPIADSHKVMTSGYEGTRPSVSPQSTHRLQNHPKVGTLT